MQSINQPMARSEMLYLGLVTLFCTVIIVANLISVKLVALPWAEQYAIPCGLLLYPLTFLISDLITELFGMNRAKFMVYLGFAMGVLTLGALYLSINLTPHQQWVSSYNPYGYESAAAYQVAYASIFGLNGIALLSSVLAYSVSQILDIRIFSFLKELTFGRFLWLRNSGSTLTSQLVDTLVVNVLFLYCGLKLDLTTVISISLVCYVYKIAFTVTNIPLFYLLVSLSKSYLGEEYEEIAPKLLATPQPDPEEA